MTSSTSTLQLFGSTTSPYVRRLRIYMQDIEHEFVLVDIFNSRDRSTIAKDNPSLKIPMLKHADQVLLDSSVIQQYVESQNKITPLSWPQKSLLSTIDAASDSLVQLLILSRSDIDISADKMYFRIQRERLDVVFAHLEQSASENAFGEWNYLGLI